MNSSGIKRGLAATAVSALAIAGVPLLASSASAAPGETLAVVSVGPTLNGGDVGGLIRLKTNAPITKFNGTAGELALANPNLNADPDNGNQAIDIIDTAATVQYIASGAAGDSLPNDGLAEVLVNVKATTSDTGATATYALFIDEDTPGAPVDGDVDAGEARAQVSQSTSGALASLEVTPTSQSAAQGQTSGAFTVTAKDAQGRTTQLNTGETVAVSSAEATVTEAGDADGGVIDADELEDGTASFTASSTGVTPVASYPIVLNPSSLADPTGNQTVNLNVTKAATIADAEVDIVTAADDWNGFGGDAGAGNTLVRVDQSSIRIDFKSADPVNDANSTVTLTLTGGGITFGGQGSTTVSTVLDANGVGSITITPDALSVQEGDTIAITGTFAETLEFDRAEATAVTAGAPKYFGQLKGTVNVTAMIKDQFGQPVTSGFLVGTRSGAGTGNPNTDTQPKFAPVGADGSATLAFEDKVQVNNGTDTVDLMWFKDQFSPQVPPGDATPGQTTIVWTTDGKGSDFATSIEGQDTTTPTYNPATNAIIPLVDATVIDANEAATLSVANTETGVPITVEVNNGALILEPGETNLEQGSASITTTTVGGALPAGYQIVGTQAGLVTATVTSAGRTETAQFTVSPQTNAAFARNVTVSGPATVEHGTTQIPFTAVVTDAHGNGIPNIAISALNIQVTGPAQFQDSSAVTNANGEITINVRVDADAEGDVSVTVTGLPGAGNQFGAAEDRLQASSANNTGAIGLPASSNVANATTTVEGQEVVDPEVSVSRKNKGKKDVITVKAIPAAAGASVVVKGGGQTKTGTLNENGKVVLTFKDKNGKKKTKYTITVGATDATTAKTVTKKFS